MKRIKFKNVKDLTSFCSFPKKGWKVDGDGEIRNGNACPISSVVGLEAQDHEMVATCFGMDDELVELIVDAADNSVEDLKQIVTYDKDYGNSPARVIAVRKALFTALKLPMSRL